jgi:hypothetical protein
MFKKVQAAGRLEAARKSLIFKKFAQCIGIASLVLVTNYGQFLGGGSDSRMHTPRPLTAICLAHLTDILIVTLLLFGVLMLLRRTPFYQWARLVLAILIPPYLIERSQSLFPQGLIDGLVLVLAAVWAAVLLLLLLRFPLWYRRTLRIASAICAFFALFAVSSIGQLIWVAAWKPGPQQRHAAWENAAQPPRTHPRIVWLVFDELSYDQLFEHRAHDLQLPHFDALRAQSTLFTNAQPIGSRTVKIIPSLLSGRTVDDFHYSVKNRFWVHNDGMSGWRRLAGSGSLFGDAHRNGWRTGVVGWYNPYCTVYGDAIDDCYWNNLDRFDGPMAPTAGFWQNVYSPLHQMVREIRSPAKADRDLCTVDVRQRLKTHLDLKAHAQTLIETDQADFVFIHLGVPHSPNIWSRIRDAYTSTCDSSYLDNLALADRILGEVLADLQASPRWKDTTLLVQGDHSWRTEIWDGLPAWTDEDDEASRGTFDPRPAVILHQAGQTHPATVAQPWSILQIHEVLDQILRNQPTHL